MENRDLCQTNSLCTKIITPFYSEFLLLCVELPGIIMFLCLRNLSLLIGTESLGESHVPAQTPSDMKSIPQTDTGTTSLPRASVLPSHMRESTLVTEKASSITSDTKTSTDLSFKSAIESVSAGISQSSQVDKLPL